ncbi:MAG: ATP-binding protein [bacterium]
MSSHPTTTNTLLERTQVELARMELELASETARRRQAEERLRHSEELLRADEQLHRVIETTQLRRAEEALMASESRFKTFMDKLPASVTIKDNAGVILYINQYLRDNFEAEDWIGKTMTDLLPSSVARGMDRADRRAVTHGLVTTTDTAIDRLGDRHIYHTFRFPIPRESGAPLVGSIGLDITDLENTEQERMRLAIAISQTEEGIMIADPDGKIEYVNPAFEQITGFPPQEVIGQDADGFCSCTAGGLSYGEMQEISAREGVWRGPVRGARKTGVSSQTETAVSPVHCSSGEIINYVSVLRDMSREVELEGQLRHAQKMEAIGTLAGGIAHDFNNILYAVIGYAKLALDDVAPESETYYCLEEVLRGGERAKDLVKHILTFTRQTKPELQAVKLQELIEEVTRFLGGSLPATIEIQQAVTPDCGAVWGDSTQLQKVVMNLCTNAYQAMRQSGGVLKISLRPMGTETDYFPDNPDLKPGSYLKLSVRDTGCGMDETTRSRLFEPYFTTKSVGEGTGLGLSVVHGIVQGHGGQITVQSEAGRGATFNVYLPRHDAEDQTKSYPAADTTKPAAGGRVLYVDDEESLAMLGAQILGRKGFEVATFSDSREALHAFEADPDAFDVVVTDQTMPGLTGTELAARIRTVRPDLPIILTTGFCDTIDEQKALELGFHRYFMKPLKNEALAEAIRQALDSDTEREA